jgi:CRP-like cAMP-binding protein
MDERVRIADVTETRSDTAIGQILIRKLAKAGPLSEEDRTALAELPFRLRNYARGDIIVEQGESPEESALLLEGLAFRYKLLPDGQRQIVSLQVPGDFMDLHSWVLIPLDHAIAAGSPARVARVPHSALAAITARYPHLTRALMWDMALDGAVGREWLANIGRRSAYRQLAHLFCELYFRLQAVGLVHDRGFEMVLTQAELGDACGLSTVHVNRSLQALRKDGLIVLESHQLVVPDLDALMDAAAFDPAYLHLLA